MVASRPTNRIRSSASRSAATGDEAAGHRVKAKRADALATRLVTAHADLTGKPVGRPATSGRERAQRLPRWGLPRCCAEALDQAQSIPRD
jgi:hypothetical protein